MGYSLECIKVLDVFCVNQSIDSEKFSDCFLLVSYVVFSSQPFLGYASTSNYYTRKIISFSAYTVLFFV